MVPTRTTHLLLGLIAAGLFAHAAALLFRPATAEAAERVDCNIAWIGGSSVYGALPVKGEMELGGRTPVQVDVVRVGGSSLSGNVLPIGAREPLPVDIAEVGGQRQHGQALQVQTR